MFCITWSYSYVFALFVYLDHISKHSLESKHLILYCHAQKKKHRCLGICRCERINEQFK